MGYELLRVNGQLIKGHTPAEVTNLLNGPVGTVVELEAVGLIRRVPDLVRIKRAYIKADPPEIHELDYATFTAVGAIIDKACSFDQHTASMQISKLKQAADFDTAEALYRLVATKTPIESTIFFAGTKVTHLATLGLYFASLGRLQGMIEVCNEIIRTLPSGQRI